MIRSNELARSVESAFGSLKTRSQWKVLVSMLSGHWALKRLRPAKHKRSHRTLMSPFRQRRAWMGT